MNTSLLTSPEGNPPAEPPPMTVRELIAHLSRLPGDCRVYSLAPGDFVKEIWLGNVTDAGVVDARKGVDWGDELTANTVFLGT